VGTVANRVARSALGRARRGGHPAWLVVAAAAWSLARARRTAHREAYRTVVREGTHLVVDVRAPERGRRRRRAAG
jgi:hypothetical protein